MPSRYGQRNRDRQSRNELSRVEFTIDDRKVLVVCLTATGPTARLACDPDRISPADKERLADGLLTYFPRLSHDQRFEMLFALK